MISDFTFNQIQFDPQAHRYHLQGRELVSVTKIIKRLEPAFDRQGIAAKKARKTGQSVGDILAEWEAKGQAGRERGTRVHRYIEQALRGQLPYDNPIQALNDRLPEMDGFDVLWQRMQGLLQPRLEYVEWVVGDPALGVAGTLDTLLFSGTTGQSHIFDWKTGKFFVENPFQKLLPPFDDLSASEFNKYSLQISLYRLIVERYTGTEMGEGQIAHLAQSGAYQIYTALDLRARLLDWLTPQGMPVGASH